MRHNKIGISFGNFDRREFSCEEVADFNLWCSAEVERHRGFQHQVFAQACTLMFISCIKNVESILDLILVVEGCTCAMVQFL